MLTEEERKKLIVKLNLSFCIPELWENRESFLNLTEKQYKSSLYDVSTAILCKIMNGDIQEIIDACIAADQAAKLVKMNEEA